MRKHPLNRMRIGSWPGPNYVHNEFIQLFCKSLEDSALEVVDVPDPRRVAASAIDVLHIHWPEKVFWDDGPMHRVIARLAATLMSIRHLKSSGVRMVWTVHNLKPHDLEHRYRLLWPVYLLQLCALTDGFVTLSPATIDVVRQQIHGLSRKPAIYAWHPAYPHNHVTVDRKEWRVQHGIHPDTFLFAFLGLIRPYKGIEELIGAFRNVGKANASLLIAGATVRDDYGARIRSLADEDSRIHLKLQRLSDDEFAAFGAAADCIVLPFRDTLHSGSLVHALSQHWSALTPETPFSRSLQQVVGADWVQTYTPPLTPDILLSAKPANGVPLLDALSTSISGPRLAAFYHGILGAPDGRVDESIGNTSPQLDVE